jgi:tRNA isopentenyl-2-thiomethyl-A-37 hydroxylase MiaE
VSRTSREWWNAIKSDDQKLVAWLRRQWNSEWGANVLIDRLLGDRLDPTDRRHVTLAVIKAQEQVHGELIAGLIQARGVALPWPDAPGSSRYWSIVLPACDSFVNAAAIAHHVEALSVERLSIIARDLDGPADVREVFARILRDERFHARAFEKMAGATAIEQMRPVHLAGTRALGLESEAL